MWKFRLYEVSSWFAKKKSSESSHDLVGTVVSEKPDKKDSLILTAFSLVSDNYDKMRNCNEI